MTRVLLTAGASGIGWAIATAFANQGARVHLCDLVPAPAHENITSALCNVADEQALETWLTQSLATLGGVDVLINNAGIAGPVGLVETVTSEGWRNCLDINLTAQFLTARKVAPLMKAQKSGSIINMSSVSGLYGVGLRSPYVAAKWAIIGFTKSLAIELGPHNVRVNAICPGSVEGDRMDRVVNAEAKQRGVSPEQVRAEYTQGQSIHRFVAPSEIADMCLFLASPAARMVSGQALAVDGHTETFHMGS
jgi:NAD(P)-dependent dehydrogenase (short-subunit alcohol dehydrogenase family)